MRFANKVALITGAGSGIGAATARRMGGEGAAVGVMGRTAATVERTVRQVVDTGGDGVHDLQVEVRPEPVAVLRPRRESGGRDQPARKPQREPSLGEHGPGRPL